MKAVTKIVASVLVPLLVVAPLPAQVEQPADPVAAPAEKAATFTAAQLEQMAAPIALYPDSLLTQILMASTYPLEIVEAARWGQKNTGVTGAALEEALKAQEWDPSVKSLCGFPDVLKRMNENLDWTQDMGDAFLGQKSDLLDAVQRMRNKASDAGNLKTTEQQTVTKQEDKIIVIESASPEVIYVPTYSPTVVYGSWYYPHWYYPPMYVAPPPGYGMMVFAVGVAWGAAVWGGCHWGWGHSSVHINVNHYNNFNNNTNINANHNNIQNTAGNKADWNHNPEHRKGVNYKSPQTAQQYGAKEGANRVTKDQARGYDRSSAGGHQTGATASTRNAGSNRSPSASPSRSRASTGQSSAWSGSGSAGMDRSASSRGAASRGGGGMSRAGGGRRR